MADAADKIESFRALADSYRADVTKVEGDIASCEARLLALRLQIAEAEREKKEHNAARTRKIALLDGVKTMIRSVEDHEASVRRAAEDEMDPK